MRFQKSIKSNKTALCGRLAKQVAAVLTRAGVPSVSVDASRVSASHYVLIPPSLGPEHIDPEYGALEYVKIRVSDHDDRNWPSEHYIWDTDAVDKVWLVKAAKILSDRYPTLTLAKRDAVAIAGLQGSAA